MMMMMRGGGGSSSSEVEVEPLLPRQQPPFTLPASLPPHPSITLPALPPTLITHPPTTSNTNHHNPNAQSSPMISPPNASSSSSSHLTLVSILAVFVTVTALALLWFLVYLIKRQKQQIHQLGKLIPTPPHSQLLGSKQQQQQHAIHGSAPPSSLSVHWSKDILPLHSPKNPLKRWLKDSTTFRRFTYTEIQKSTDDFSSVIGKGGFGTVYKARFEDGSAAAIKRMSRVSRQREKEFCREMEFLGRLHHRHLVTLRGFCITRTERFLVYEFMENGSLNEHLQGHSKRPLDWGTRIQIAIDVAAALEYLHFFCEPPLCHRDIKSSNILLDQHFSAKVADFGLAHATPVIPTCINDHQMSTDVRGTPGYLDPEYVVTRQLTVKSDIYSYGVLLLELVTGRAAVQDHHNLVAWAQPYLASIDDNNVNGTAKLALMVDPSLQSLFERTDVVACKQLRNMARLIHMCTAKEAKARPSIRQVLAFLYDRFELNCNHNDNKLESCVANIEESSITSDLTTHHQMPPNSQRSSSTFRPLPQGRMSSIRPCSALT